MDTLKSSPDHASENATFKFSPLRKIESTEANIFIHGYSAGHDLEDRQTLIHSIPPELHDQLNILAFWPSSHFLRLNGTTKKLIFAASRIHIIASAAALAVDRVAHFARIRARAEEMGSALFNQLEEYLLRHHPQVTRINLVGHSLGGRVVVTALKNRSLGKPQEHPQIGDVLLMAAAAKVSSMEAAAMRNLIEGRLINTYSKDDNVLLLNADEVCLGRNEVTFFENVHMEGFGHSDYWPKLREVMKKAGFSALSRPTTSLAPQSEGDFAKNDAQLYQVLRHSDSGLLDAAIAHLKSSTWTSIQDSEADRALAFTRELQAVAGHCLVNFARGNGLSYWKTLEMLTDHYGLTSKLHHCTKVVEYEEELLKHVFQHAFPDGHPLTSATVVLTKAIPQCTYLEAVDALAKRLTLASYFQLAEQASSPPEPVIAEAMAGNSTIADTAQAYLRNAFDLLRSLEKESARVLTNLKTAIKPGYSGLIPAIAIVHYARLQVDEEDLM
ncbi:DUF726 domain-containing protein [Pseudomonas sp. MIL19]|uniref:DUF726 domain-containing protein n=1 Tax=Pseudomonas sp. MIL19 TaxID=2976979 RepID=UPI00236360F3|nr:DUF726 domain-containing protein [Pseudomonas sp. MIL19]MDD2162574.1 DUF726 domain-containing protein [Pseudomonas sp. MIL19]